MLSTLAQRAWFAWHCLPRTEKGQPPSIRSLEGAYELSNAQLRKLIMGLSKRPSYGELVKMAMALDCDPEWLQSGQGEGPRATTFIPEGPPLPKPKGSMPGRDDGLRANEIVLFERKARQLGQRASALTGKRARK